MSAMVSIAGEFPYLVLASGATAGPDYGDRDHLDLPIRTQSSHLLLFNLIRLAAVAVGLEEGMVRKDISWTSASSRTSCQFNFFFSDASFFCLQLLCHVDRLASSDDSRFVHASRATFVILVQEILRHRVARDVTVISDVSAVDAHVIIALAWRAIAVRPRHSCLVSLAFVLAFVVFVFINLASAALVIGYVSDKFLTGRTTVNSASFVTGRFIVDTFAYRAVERPLIVWSRSIVVHAVV